MAATRELAGLCSLLSNGKDCSGTSGEVAYGIFTQNEGYLVGLGDEFDLNDW